jgi:hypothetical protein
MVCIFNRFDLASKPQSRQRPTMFHSGQWTYTTSRTRSPHVCPYTTSRTRSPHVSPYTTSRTRSPHVSPYTTSRTRSPHVSPYTTSRTRSPHVSPSSNHNYQVHLRGAVMNTIQLTSICTFRWVNGRIVKQRLRLATSNATTIAEFIYGWIRWTTKCAKITCNRRSSNQCEQTKISITTTFTSNWLLINRRQLQMAKWPTTLMQTSENTYIKNSSPKSMNEPSNLIVNMNANSLHFVCNKM